MITPGLLRHALRRALRWRVLAIWWASLLVPSILAALPAFWFLRAALDHSTRAQDVAAWMDGATLIDLLRRLSENGASEALLLGLVGALFALLLTSPFAAAAMVAASAAGEPAPFPRLLAGAGALYGRMLRLSVLALIPLAAAAAGTAGIAKLALRANERVATETAANRNLAVAAAAAAAVLFLAHLLADAARAQFAADPGRRSAAAALVAAARLLVRRPLRSGAVGLLGAAVGLGGALALMALRLQIAQRGPATLTLAWMLGQAARLAVGWGRAARVEGFTELSRADTAQRGRPEAGPEVSMAGRQAEVVDSETLSALEPPRSGAPR